jgi:hypothetical protein
LIIHAEQQKNTRVQKKRSTPVRPTKFVTSLLNNAACLTINCGGDKIQHKYQNWQTLWYQQLSNMVSLAPKE